MTASKEKLETIMMALISYSRKGRYYKIKNSFNVCYFSAPLYVMAVRLERVLKTGLDVQLGRYPSIVAHELKLQKASVDPAVMKSGLWKNIQDQNCPERPETSADHLPLHCETSTEQTHHLLSTTQPMT